MPYNQLNLARITAVQNMQTGSTCNLCLKVVNTANPQKFIHVLAVDLGGNGLDVSLYGNTMHINIYLLTAFIIVLS